MMDRPLLLSSFLERAALLFPRKEVITRTPSGLHRITYADVDRRTRRLARALGALGVRGGDRVGTFAWNSWRHLELYLGVPSSGAVLHTVNIRLFPEQIVYIVNHAEDRVLCVDDVLLPLLAPHAKELTTVEHLVVMGDGELPAGLFPNVHRYEDLLASAPDDFQWPSFDERTAAGMCYTSGTTGHPKGVVYSHRSMVLQSYAQAMVDAFAICERDRILSVVPMFHANAWGLPYTGTMVGADQIYPGPQPTPRDICRLVQELRVTVTAGVPTVLLGMLQVLEQEPFDLSSLRAVPCGGSAVPESLLARFDAIGIEVIQAWGMTETSPLATICRPRSTMDAYTPAQRRAVRAKQGMPVPGVDLRVVGEDGAVLPWDGRSVGELQVRGPWITSGYHADDRNDAAFDDGWFRTGDVSHIDADGYVTITDRAKDVIKSGGEWISSVELENAIMAHPDVLEAAVVGMPHARWQERPLACVVPKPGKTLARRDVLDFLDSRVAKWWLPEDVLFLEAIPKTSVGKFAKKQLREQLAGYRFPGD
ncbi:MAG: long-chain fatty acid--CoA ligase [bacterium]|nr:long-chain fatty acid--CoA ligase [bacterium]